MINFLEDLAKSYSSDGLRRQLDTFLQLPKGIYTHGYYYPSVGTSAGPIYAIDGYVFVFAFTIFVLQYRFEENTVVTRYLPVLQARRANHLTARVQQWKLSRV